MSGVTDLDTWRWFKAGGLEFETSMSEKEQRALVLKGSDITNPANRKFIGLCRKYSINDRCVRAEQRREERASR